MGMAASQARFLQLTSRKTNIEYMGQQINQQRLALANQSAGLFEQMLTMEPPVPPSSLDEKYYTQGYTFEDPVDGAQKKIHWKTLSDAVSDGDVLGTDTYNVSYHNLTDGSSGVVVNPGLTNFNDMIANYTDDETTNGTDIDLTNLRTAMGVYPTADTVRNVMRYVTIEHTKYDPDGNPVLVEEKMPAILEFDNSQRLINIVPLSERLTYTDYYMGLLVNFTSLNTGTDRAEGTIGTGESLTYSGHFDEKKFNDDMNRYEFLKSVYDYDVERINLETAKVQKQDKSLELKMKQLDTEHKAITTEADAVQKVIQKNIDSTFKTFG